MPNNGGVLLYLTNLIKRKTLKLQGVLQRKDVSMLIGTGSTTTFLNKTLAVDLQLQGRENGTTEGYY